MDKALDKWIPPKIGTGESEIYSFTLIQQRLQAHMSKKGVV